MCRSEGKSHRTFEKLTNKKNSLIYLLRFPPVGSAGIRVLSLRRPIRSIYFARVPRRRRSGAGDSQ